MGSTNFGPSFNENVGLPGGTPGPSQQGCIGTCVAHSLAKCVLAAGENQTPEVDFRQDEVISACVQLGGENAAKFGSWPDWFGWNGKSVFTKEFGVSADATGGPTGKTYKATFAIQECNPADYDDQNEYVLALHTDHCPAINAEKAGYHCVYIKSKKGKFWYFLNSHGTQPEMRIEINNEFNKLYTVDVAIQEIQNVPETSVQGEQAGLGVAIKITKEDQLDKIKRVITREISYDSVEVFAKMLELKHVYNEWANNPALGLSKTVELRVDFIIDKWKQYNGRRATTEAMSKKLAENPKFTNIKDEFDKEFGF